MTDRSVRSRALLLLGGYVGMFLVLHWPFRETVVGLLGMRPGYLPAALALHPLARLSAALGLEGTLVAQAAFVLVVALLFGAYLSALARLRAGAPLRLRELLLWTALFGLPLLITPYLLSSDVYSYILYGRLGALYGLNPALSPPDAVPGDPFLAFLPHWTGTPSVYGPLWNIVAAGLALLAHGLGGAPWLTLLVFKLAALAMHLACATLVWGIAGGWHPELRAWAAALYAWNPLALIETAGSAHNDVLMLALLLLGLWLAGRGRWRAATLAIALAALAKYLAALALPVYALWLLRRRPTWGARLADAAQMLGLALASAVVLYAPFWAGGQALAWMRGGINVSLALNSPYMLTERLLRLAGLAQSSGAERLASTLNNTASRAVMLLACLGAALAAWRRPTPERLLAASFWLFLLILLLALPWFWPWYVLWVLGLTPFAGWRPARATALTLSASSLAIYLEIAPRPLYVFGPPLALLLFSLGRALLRRRRAAPNDQRPTSSPQPTLEA